MKNFKKVGVLSTLVILLPIVVWAVFYLVRVIDFTRTIRRHVTEQEREIIYRIDHDALAGELRTLFRDQTRQGNIRGPIPRVIPGGDPAIPTCLRILKPSGIAVFSDHIELVFGGLMLHFGIAVFPENVEGRGTKRLGKGIWFYSEDGSCPKED